MDTNTPTVEPAGYFVWERGPKGPTYQKYEKAAYDMPHADTAKAYADRMLKKYPLTAEQYALPIDTIKLFCPLPAEKAAEVVLPKITKLSMYCNLSKVQRDDKTGHVIGLAGLNDAFNVGVISLASGWKAGARIKWSLELAPNETLGPAEVEIPIKPAGSAPEAVAMPDQVEIVAP